MQLYENLGVTVTYQNSGSSWLLVMRGPTEEIELATNGLFNWGATNGDVHYHDGAHTVGLVWTSKPMLEKFFFNLKMQTMLNSKTRALSDEELDALEKNLIPACKSFAKSKIKELRTARPPRKLFSLHKSSHARNPQRRGPERRTSRQ